MRAEPVMARANGPLAQAVLARDQAGINRLPVVDLAGRPAGILTRGDVLRVLARRIRRPGRGVSSARLWQLSGPHSGGVANECRTARIR